MDNYNDIFDDEKLETCMKTLAIKYIKWISYIPNFILNRLSTLKDQDNLDINDIDFLNEMKLQEKVLPYFEKFIFSSVNNDEKRIVYDYILSHSLPELIQQKLTNNEIESLYDFNNSLTKAQKWALEDFGDNIDNPNANHLK